MNGATQTSLTGWTYRKFWRVAAIVFVAQCVVVFILSDRDTTATQNSRPGTFFRLIAKPVTDSEILDGVFASDPTLFVLPSRNGFSGLAWLKLKNAEYALPQWDEPPRFLAFNTEELGRNVLREARSSALPKIEINGALVSDGAEIPLPVREQKPSIYRVDGELQARFVESRRVPSAWPRADLLGDTVVQVAINGAGDVVIGRLLPPGSGWRPADEEALEIARTARYQPRNDAVATNLTWGTFVFQWQTLPLEETNAIGTSAILETPR